MGPCSAMAADKVDYVFISTCLDMHISSSYNAYNLQPESYVLQIWKTLKKHIGDTIPDMTVPDRHLEPRVIYTYVLFHILFEDILKYEVVTLLPSFRSSDGLSHYILMLRDLLEHP